MAKKAKARAWWRKRPAGQSAAIPAPTLEQERLYQQLQGRVKKAAQPIHVEDHIAILSQQLESALKQLNRRANVAQLLKAHDAALAALDLGVERVQAALQVLYVGKEEGE